MTPQEAQAVQALQGQQSPAMSGLFGVQPQQLQQLAGDVLPMPGAAGAGAGTVNDLQSALQQAKQPGSNVKPYPFAPATAQHWLNIMQQHNVPVFGK